MRLLRPDAGTLSAVAEAFGLDDGPRGLTPIARGGNGQVWRLDGARRSYAVKELFAGGDEKRIAESVAYCTAAIAAGIRAPSCFRTIDGRFLADVGGVVVRLASWADGREPLPGDPGVAEWLGRTLATLHTLGYPIPRSGAAPADATVPDPAVWRDLTRRGAEARRPWAPALSQAAPELVRLGARTRPVDPDRLVFSHHDVQPSNVLLDPQSGSYTLLDWDGAGPIDPGRELASRLFTWHVHDDRLDVDGVRRTLLAYRDFGGVAEVGEAEVYGGLPDALAYLANQAQASLDDDLPAAMREHSTRETSLLLREPPSPALFDQILALAARR